VDSLYGDAAHRGFRTRIAEGLSRRSRAARWQLFERLMAPGMDSSILDVGCGDAGLAAYGPELAITGVDRSARPAYVNGRRRFVQADAAALPFDDGVFDIAHSNSVIEHIVDPADRRRFAREIRRVSGRYFVQTPNRWFPIEPHSLLPFVHWLPRTWGARLWRFGVGGDPFEQTKLLDKRELARLLPDARIVRERFGPFTKSIVAVGPHEGAGTATLP
jgi:SAM-dependent methyltransferase